MAKVSKYGQWKYPGEDTIIPSGDITMQGVPYPVLGIDDLGNAKMMQPGGNYTFPGTAVYEIPMMAYGGDISVPSLKRVKIKSLPKAQTVGGIGIGYLGDVTQEESDYWDQSYKKWRDKNLSYRDAYDAATADVNTWRGPSHPNYVYNSSAFLPNEDSGVIVTSQKSKPYKHLQDWPDFNESGFASDFYGNTDDAVKWEKNWYSQRATLPQFKDIAEERLNLAESINMQPWSTNNWKNSSSPNAGGYYSWGDTSVNVPQQYFSHPLIYTHERSHWYDYNAPQDKMISGYWGTNPIPLYNEYDPILNDIIPKEYLTPGGEGATNDVNSKESIYLPFQDTKEWGLKYYTNPTEVRARLNEWRRRNNIDPLKNYSNEEIQQIIDEDIKSGNSINFDLYKVIRGRGDLLKQINDAYVSNDTPNEDELPKAQTGGSTEEEILANRNKAFQDIIVDDEMFDEGDFELYLDQAQTGGELPDDYQDFLNYSETAPENRRPDSEWQYGNPRQYDHYGMWDALGKPKTFEEALAKNPHWQPDPYDGMYHGFSTNPDTGVWLKSHIPGESHPGDTGWMEYKDFMLSNDRNWGGKNQNLVFDPELQRMRYIERKQDGGGIMNMLQQVGYKPQPQEPSQVFQKVTDMFNGKYPIEQKEPGVFEQLQTMIGTPKPTLSVQEQIKQAMDKISSPKPEPVSVKFQIPEDYYTRLMEQENGINRGLKGDRFYQYPSEEGGNDTIGYGHKLTDDDVKAGRYSKGLTKDEAIVLMRNDVEEHLDRTLEQYEAKFGKGSFDKLHPDLKVLALDFVYNGLPIDEYPNFFGAANQYSTTKDANVKKQAYEKMLKNYIRNVEKNGVLVPLGERNKYTRSVLDNLK